MTETQKHQATFGFLRDRISCGWAHAAGVLDDGTVKAVGDNQSKQCEVSDWTDIVKIKCGIARTVGLKKDGTVLSTKGDVYTDGRIPDEGIERFNNIVDIDCGLFHTVGLRSDGTVMACGFNDDGQCNVEGWSNVKRIYAAHSHTIAVCNDGSLLYCGRNDGGALQLNGLSSVDKLYCGLNDTVIITTDNKVYRTDDDSDTPILLDLAGDEVAHVTFHVNHYMILKTDGTVLHFGSTEDCKDQVSDWTNILEIVCCERVSVGIAKDNIYMTSTFGTRTMDLSQIALQLDGNNITVFVQKGGKVIAYGKNGEYEQSGSFQLFNSIPSFKITEGEKMQAAQEIERTAEPHKAGIAWEHKQKYGYLNRRMGGGIAHNAGVMYDGTMKACGGNGLGQCDVEGWSDIVEVACTAGATLGLRKDGKVFYTGQIPFNADGGFAVGTHPTQWPGNVKAIEGCIHSQDHVVGLLDDGNVVAYGSNEEGQCNVGSWCDIVELSVQPGLTAGVRKDGTVVVCGKDSEIKEIVSKWTNIEHLYKGTDEQSLIGLKYDGTVVSTMTDPKFDMSEWKDIIYISAGYSFIVGLTGGGHLYFTGDVPYDKKTNGLDGILCVNANINVVMAANNEHTSYIINIRKGAANQNVVKWGSLAYQNGFAHQLTLLEIGCVISNVMSDEFDCGQNDTEDWQLLQPTPKSAEENSSTNSASNSSSTGSSTGCYVATCVYGSYDCPQVWTLRRYRDDTLGSTWYGRLFIRTYYAISPMLVKWFGHTDWFKKLWKGKLDRMVANLQAKGVEDTPYEDKNW